MQLWNDYEGKIVEGHPVGHLLRPEGRSAFFEITEGPDAPAVIRITESLNDEEQMLALWGKVSELKQENLIAIRRFGQAAVEGTPLTYAVMEASDAALADILTERSLTHDEALQVARSVAAALAPLHAAGLVHRHVSAENVLAVGETVKLRSDCASECLADPDITTPAECKELVARDVHDLALLILRVLTLERKISPGTRLQAPFDKIVANGITGAWGLEDISRVLNPVPVKPLVPESVIVPKQAVVAAAPQAELNFEKPIVPRVEEVVSRPAHGPIVLPRQLVAETSGRGMRWWMGCAAAVIVLVLLLVRFTGTKTPQNSGVVADSAAAVGTASPSQPTPAALAAPVSNGIQPSESTASVSPTISHLPGGWYVIAYTYNREDQAWKKVAGIIKQHASLKPLVISPNGRGPFMIAFGGAMSKEEAESVRSRARRAGMPRDTFIRNYPS